MIHDNCTIRKSESSYLPAIAENGFMTVSDFLAHHHESIEASLKNSEFQYLIAFHPDPPDLENLWRLGAFRVYVSKEQLEAAREFCMFIEFISSPNRNS